MFHEYRDFVSVEVRVGHPIQRHKRRLARNAADRIIYHSIHEASRAPRWNCRRCAAVEIRRPRAPDRVRLTPGYRSLYVCSR